MPNVNLTAPTDYTAEAADIARRRKMAELLQQQGMTPIEQQTAGGYVIPTSWTQGLAKALQAGSGAYQQNQLKGEEKALAQKSRDEFGNWIGQMPQAGQDLNPVKMDDEGNAATPTLSGNPSRQQMLSWAMQGAGSGNPVSQPMAGAYLAQLMKQDEPYSLREGEKRFGPGGTVLAANEKPPALHFADTGTGIQGLNPNTGAPVGPATTKAVKAEIGPSGQAYNPYTLQPGTVLADVNKPFQADPAGGAPKPNAPYQNYELTKAKVGANMQNVTVNTEKQLYGNIAEGVGKEVANATQNAKAAVSTLNTVGQIRSALDSGKAIAGPATTARVFLGQIGQVIGVAGKDATEQLTNTRSAIQGLAQLELDAAQQMKGQGQITEAERGIIRRAASGDIDGMTIPELRTLTNTLDKTARYKIKLNSANVAKVKANPASASLADFMEVPEPPPYQPQRRASDRAAPKFLGFE